MDCERTEDTTLCAACAKGTMAVLDADFALTTDWPSLRLSLTDFRHVSTRLFPPTADAVSSMGSTLSRKTTSMLLPSKSSTAALKTPLSSSRVAGEP